MPLTRFLIPMGAAIALTTPATAQIYQCEQPNGSTLFSQTPCASDAAEVRLNARDPDLENAAPQSRQTARVQKRRDRERHQRAIRELESERDDLESEMDQAIARIHRKRERASNNLAGATWETALAQEEQAILQRYQPRIDRIESEIRTLRENRP